MSYEGKNLSKGCNMGMYRFQGVGICRVQGLGFPVIRAVG